LAALADYLCGAIVDALGCVWATFHPGDFVGAAFTDTA
jgi:hypothetical protein